MDGERSTELLIQTEFDELFPVISPDGGWMRDQVRGLFDSLYRRHPVGGLLVWATESKTAEHRGDGPLAAGVVKLLRRARQP